MTRINPAKASARPRNRESHESSKTTYEKLLSLRAASDSCVLIEAALIPSNRFSYLTNTHSKKTRD